MSHKQSIRDREIEYYKQNTELMQNRSREFYKNNKEYIRQKQKELYLKKRFGLDVVDVPPLKKTYGSFNPFS
jgi:hypothetical protein